LCRVVSYRGPGLPRPTTRRESAIWVSAYSEVFGGRLFASLALGCFALFALGLLGCLACTLALEVLGRRRSDDVDDEHLGIRHQRHTGGKGDRGRGELGADLGGPRPKR